MYRLSSVPDMKGHHNQSAEQVDSSEVSTPSVFFRRTNHTGDVALTQLITVNHTNLFHTHAHVKGGGEVRDLLAKGSCAEIKSKQHKLVESMG
jgi:hypothetical protein